MARLRIDLDRETFVRLVESAVEEQRPVVWQAEVLLRRALAPLASSPTPSNVSDNPCPPDLAQRVTA